MVCTYKSDYSNYFIIIGILTILGIMGGHFVGFETFTKGDGPILGGNLGGSLLSILGVFLVAGFSFQGTELIGITAGESENPERAVPKAIKQSFLENIIILHFSHLCYWYVNSLQ